MKRLRVYIDSSVVGGCLDAEFAVPSRALLDMAREGQVTLLISNILLAELANGAPQDVVSLLDGLPAHAKEEIETGMDSEYLRDRYLEAGVVGDSASVDAHHVAMATVAGADIIVSWNFKHIVHFDKIRRFNAVNLVEGYQAIEIRSPKEVA